MSATDYLEAKLLNHVLRNAAFAQPTALYLALHTADPGEAGSANEVTGGSYAEQTIAFASATGSNPTQAVSSADVVFTGMPAVTVTHFSIKDGLGGNSLYDGPLGTPRTATAGQTLTFPAGSVVVNCD